MRWKRLGRILVSLALVAALPGFVAADSTYADWLLSDRYASYSEHSTRQDIFAAVEDSLWNKRFDKLEALAQKFRREKSRTPSGLWKLSFFYEGVKRFYRGASSSGSTDPEGTIKSWLNAYPNSATSHIAYAAMLNARAWEVRGTGYVSTVPKEAWKPLKEVVERAFVALQQSKEVAASDPQWYTEMAEIATFQDWPIDKFSALIDEALDREPLYFDTYFAAVNRYLPKWGGNADMVERFARAAVERTREAEGSALYARIYWSASGGQYRDDLFEDSLADWAEMSRGIDDVVAKYPDRWNLSHFAYFACLAGDYAKALDLMNRVQGDVLTEPWGGWFGYYRCRWWAEVVVG